MNDQTYKDYLDGLKPGDNVEFIERSPWRTRGVGYLTVVRRTATQIVCENQYRQVVRYRASDGKKVGSSYFEKFPQPASPEETAEVRAECRRLNGVAKLERHAWDKEPLDVIEAALKLVEKKEQGE